MSDSDNKDHVRRAALDRIEKSEKQFRNTLIYAALYEGGLLVTYLVLMDFNERTHLLLLFATFLIYGTLAIGLIALGIHVNRWGERILKSIELSEEA